MEEIKRSYYLPRKLVDSFGKETNRFGFVNQKVVAAAILQFIDSDANTRSKMFDRLDKFLKSKKG